MKERRVVSYLVFDPSTVNQLHRVTLLIRKDERMNKGIKKKKINFFQISFANQHVILKLEIKLKNNNTV